MHKINKSKYKERFLFKVDIYKHYSIKTFLVRMNLKFYLDSVSSKM